MLHLSLYLNEKDTILRWSENFEDIFWKNIHN